MKNKLLFIFLLTTSIAFGQNQTLVDSLSSEICQTITTSNEKNDSIKIIDAFRKHRLPDALDFTEKQRNEIGDNVYFRLQRNCKIFRLILERNSPPNKNWKTVLLKPISKLTKRECIEFRKYKNYNYVDPLGDTVLLALNNGFWIDTFKDNTYSKLKVQWLNGCEFEIEFIESNNDIRRKFSKAGDKYKYQIIEKLGTYYLMSVEITGQNMYSLFKINY